MNRTSWFAAGLAVDDSTDTRCVRGFSPKELIHGREAERWRAACAAKPMLQSYERVRSYELRYQEYLEHPDWQVNLAPAHGPLLPCGGKGPLEWCRGDRSQVRVPRVRRGARCSISVALPPGVLALVGGA